MYKYLILVIPRLFFIRLPFPWLLYSAANSGGAVEVNSGGIGCSISLLFIMLVLVFLAIIIFKWKMTKLMGGLMLVLYIVFVIVSLGFDLCWYICPI